MVDDFAKKIDITNSQMVLQYGAASQKKLSDFSDNALSRVKTKDMGETGELITNLITELKGFDATEKEDRGLFSATCSARPSSMWSRSRPAMRRRT